MQVDSVAEDQHRVGQTRTASVHTHDFSKIVAATTVHTHDLSKIVAATTVHTHDLSKIVAATTVHTHDLSKIVAATTVHTRDFSKIVAATTVHTHDLSKIAGVYGRSSRDSPANARITVGANLDRRAAGRDQSLASHDYRSMARPAPKPHDALFKTAFEQPEHAAALLRESFAPSISAAIDWRTLAAQPGSYIDPQFIEHHSDLLFTVQLAGEEALLYVLLEHQSTSHPYMPLRMLHYSSLVWLRYCKQHDLPMPVLLSLVITHTRGGWTGPRSFVELLRPDPATIPGLAPLVPSFSLTLLDLAHLTNEELKARALADFPKLALWLLRDARDAATLLANFGTWASTLVRACATPYGMEAFALLLRYVYEVCSSLQFEQFLEKISKHLPEAEGPAMTLAEQFRQEGRQEGRQETLRATLRKLLALRFGPPSPEVEARINAASVEELDRYLERIVSAPDVAAVFAS